MSWTEYWDFLADFCDLSTADGLTQFEKYLEQRHQELCKMLTLNSDLQELDDLFNTLSLDGGGDIAASPSPVKTEDIDNLASMFGGMKQASTQLHSERSKSSHHNNPAASAATSSAAASASGDDVPSGTRDDGARDVYDSIATNCVNGANNSKSTQQQQQHLGGDNDTEFDRNYLRHRSSSNGDDDGDDGLVAATSERAASGYGVTTEHLETTLINGHIDVNTVPKRRYSDDDVESFYSARSDVTTTPPRSVDGDFDDDDDTLFAECFDSPDDDDLRRRRRQVEPERLFIYG